MPEADRRLLEAAARAAGEIALGFRRAARTRCARSPGATDRSARPTSPSTASCARRCSPRAPTTAGSPRKARTARRRLAARRVFVVDPIDGTRAFLAGQKAWALVAGGRRGRPADRRGGSPSGARPHLCRGGRRAAPPSTARRSRWPSDEPQRPRGVLAAGQRARPGVSGPAAPPPVERHFRPSLAYRLCLVAEGRFDAALSFRDTWEWDVAAGDLIAREAGATVTTRVGDPPVYNRPAPAIAGILVAAPAAARRAPRRAALTGGGRAASPPAAAVQPFRVVGVSSRRVRTREAHVAMASLTRVSAGLPFPLGATWDGSGVNVAVFSAHATRIELCLFDAEGRREIDRIALPEFTHEVWHGYFPDLRPGPALRPARARALRAARRGTASIRTSCCSTPTPARSPASCAGTTRSTATGSAAEGRPLVRPPRQRPGDAEVPDHRHRRTPGEPDHPPRRGWAETVIYEAHVKGMTASHPEITGPRAGTFEGLGSPQVVEHLARLGVTAIELMPIQAFFDDRHLVEKGPRQLLGLQHHRLLRAGAALPDAGQRHRRVQAHGAAAARGGHRGDPRRRLQPHRRGQPARADPVASAASTTPATTCWPTTRATISTPPAAATPSTPATRAWCRW